MHNTASNAAEVESFPKGKNAIDLYRTAYTNIHTFILKLSLIFCFCASGVKDISSGDANADPLFCVVSAAAVVNVSVGLLGGVPGGVFGVLGFFFFNRGSC